MITNLHLIPDGDFQHQYTKFAGNGVPEDGDDLVTNSIYNIGDTYIDEDTETLYCKIYDNGNAQDWKAILDEVGGGGSPVDIVACWNGTERVYPTIVPDSDVKIFSLNGDIINAVFTSDENQPSENNVVMIFSAVTSDGSYSVVDMNKKLVYPYRQVMSQSVRRGEDEVRINAGIIFSDQFVPYEFPSLIINWSSAAPVVSEQNAE